MICYVYKGQKVSDHYLYLAEELDENKLAELPTGLLTMLGELRLVIEFELNTQRQLPQADAVQVIRDIKQQGFYLQMPKKDMRAEEDRLFS